MSESLETISRLIEECTNEDRRALKRYLGRLCPHPLELDWGIDADTILSAIRRSSDLTKRGVRGIIAEAVFVNEVVPAASESGWHASDIEADAPFDALLHKGKLAARIQVKLQRLEAGVPKLYYPKHYELGSLYVVEVQKTRSGERALRPTIVPVSPENTTSARAKVKTRPYTFGDFDILAVNMHPSSGNWNDFRYTVASWLLPRPANENLIEIFQPVAAIPNEAWTDDLATCLKWYEGAKHLRVLDHLPHRKPRVPGAPS